MDSNILKQKVAIARRAVEGLEEPLKTEGFKTILSRLLDEEKSNTQKRITIKKTKSIHEDKDLQELPLINRTKYPQIYELEKVLERSLFILKIYRDEENIDGLTPSQIAKILTEAFRIKTSGPAVSMALMKAKLEVDRRSKTLLGGGKTYVYKLMKGGEEFLEQKLQNES
ncbi:hypothetical protein KAT80_02275 [Candidatus Pacearchaeota archaeon]|nr:hypothetical protein [Candidatus Pacearchaeota archaeon]